MDQEKQAIIKVDKLETSRQGQKILHQVDMTIEEQDVYFLIGPNGSGKSTLFKTLLGIYVPDNGSISFFQQHWDRSKRKLLKKRIGALVEDPKFYTSLTVAENLKIFARYFSVPDHSIEEVLAKVALSDKKKSKVKSLSTGMKQRLGIALSLLHNPDLVFLDEPNRGLDPNQIINLRHLIQQLNTEERKTFLISSQSSRKQQFNWIKKLVREDANLLMMALVLGFAIALMSVANAVFSQKLIDDLLPKGEILPLFTGIAILLTLLIFQSLILSGRTVSWKSLAITKTYYNLKISIRTPGTT